MNIIRLLHLEWGLNNPLQDHFKLNCVLKGIKRQRGTPPARKLPITPGLLISILNNLNLLSPSDCAVWAAGLVMFYGLLRRSNVLFSAGNKGATLSRNLICFDSWGVMLKIKKTKTIQFQERELLLPLPRIREHPLCPVQAIFRCFSLTPRAAADGPAFVVPTGAGVKPLSPAVFVKRMRTALSQSNLLLFLGCDAEN